MKRYSLVIFVALTIFSTTIEHAKADALNYTYVQLRYADVEVDDTGLDGTGFVASGSYRINDAFFAFGGYRDIDFEFGRDASALQVGGGYIYPISGRAHAMGKVFVARSEASRPGFSDSDTGHGLEVGIRGLVTPRLEARGFVNYTDIGGSDTSMTLGADYYFTPQVSAGLTTNFGGDVTGFTVGARFYFGE